MSTIPSEERASWIARNLLPLEGGIRMQIRRWRLPNDVDEEDILQETYSRFVAMADVTPIRNVRSYAISTARSIILMHLRHARVVSIQSVDDLDALAVAAEQPTPEECVSDREQLQLLAVAVSELPEPNRQAFLLRVMDELSHREIGQRLGMSDNAVQKSIAKSLSILIARLGRGGNRRARASSLDTRQANPGCQVEPRDE